MAIRLEALSIELGKEFISNFDSIVLDIDGVIWKDGKLTPGSVSTIEFLRELDKDIIFLTNDPTNSRREHTDFLNEIGVYAHEDEVLCPSFLAAHYLRSTGFSKKAYLLANEAASEDFQQLDIAHTPVGPDSLKFDFRCQCKFGVSLDPKVGAVVVGFDPHFSYMKITKAQRYLQDPNCIFIATNCEPVLRSSDEVAVPNTGSFLAALKAVTQREYILASKPGQYARDYLIKIKKINPDKTLLIGHRGVPDMVFGKQYGFTTLLTLTGSSTRCDIEMWKYSGDSNLRQAVPDFTVHTLGDLRPFL